MPLAPIFADAAECIGQAFGIGMFLLFLFGGWIVQFINSQATKAKQRQRERQIQEQADFGDAHAADRPARQQGDLLRPAPHQPRYLESEGIEILDPDVNDDIVMAAEVVEDGPAPGTMAAYLKAHGYDTPELEDQYDYKVGTLGDSSDAVHETEEEKAAGPTISPNDIAGALRNPADIRKAVILGEILTPPAERW